MINIMVKISGAARETRVLHHRDKLDVFGGAEGFVGGRYTPDDWNTIWVSHHIHDAAAIDLTERAASTYHCFGEKSPCRCQHFRS